MNDEFEISEEDFKSKEITVIEEVLNGDYDIAAPDIYKSLEIDSDEDLTRYMISKICQKGEVDAILFSSIRKYEDRLQNLSYRSGKIVFRTLEL